MRDILTDLFEAQPADPMESARRNMRRALRARFYRDATVAAAGGAAFNILLDGKPVLTPLRRPLTAPAGDLAQAIADEWNRQTETIDPGAMPLTRLANAVIDAVADAPESVRDEVVNYLGSDLVCYRADSPEGLVAMQSRLWDPVLAFARDELGARFVLVRGVMHARQPAEAIAAAARAIPADRNSPRDLWKLGALSLATMLTGSALIALALAAGRLAIDEAWAAAHADEDWQISKWGRDDAESARRVGRFEDFRAAGRALAGLR